MPDSRNSISSSSGSQTCRLQPNHKTDRRRDVSKNSLTTMFLFFTALIFASLLLTKADAAQPIVATTAASSSAAAAPASSTTRGGAASTTAAPTNTNATTTAAPASFFITTSFFTSAVTNSGRVSIVTNAVNITVPIASSTSVYTSTSLPTVSAISTGALAGTQAAPAPIGGSNALGPNDNYVTGDAMAVVCQRSTWLPLVGSVLAVALGFGLVV
ncbi:hypothetical protein OC845_002173 [Tilletia horrida]|nr:hypothetical protein OC845_002173 [Tilletia horrida]